MFRQIIKQHVYLYLLILTTIEGPVTSFVSAGAAAQGVLRIEYVAIIAFLGDILGDIGLYTIGKLSNKLPFLKKISWFSQEKHFLTKALEKTPFVYFLVAKFTPYLSAPSLIFAGAKKFHFLWFLFYSFLISFLVKAVYLTMGYVGSISLKQVTSFLDGRQKIAGYIIGGIILFLLTKHIYFSLGKRLKRHSQEQSKNNP